jgi:hypothetical protein
MSKTVLLAAFVVLTLSAVVFSQEAENPAVGKWLCDMSEQADFVADLEITADKFYVFITAGLEAMEMEGNYRFENNKIMFIIQAGETTQTADGEYFPDRDQLSVYHQDVLYTFDRVKPEEKAEEKDPK